MATIEVDGNKYEFPIGDTDRRNKIYYLKLALNGDDTAREIFLGGKEEEFFFIGKDFPLWAKVTKTDVEIIQP